MLKMLSLLKRNSKIKKLKLRSKIILNKLKIRKRLCNKREKKSKAEKTVHRNKQHKAN